MKLVHILVGFGAFSALCFFVIHFSSQNIVKDDAFHRAQLHGDQMHIKSLLELVNVQNETIHTLEMHLKRMISKSGDKTLEDAKLIEISDTIYKLTRESEENRLKVAQCNNMSSELEHNFDKELQRMKVDSISHTHCPDVHTPVSVQANPVGLHSHVEPRTKLEDQCEQRYGMELADIWGRNQEIWCADTAQPVAELRSELKCYPYHQAHKKLDGRGPDLVCEATNFVINFDAVRILLEDLRCVRYAFCCISAYS